MALNNIIIVLHRPQDATNVGAVLRAMKNMGLHQLRLVQPESFDATAILRVAHRCDDLLAATRFYADLDAALADAVYVVGTAAQRHGERPATNDMQGLAAEMLSRAAAGPVALLFGPEDNGLDNAALDRCQLIATIPSNPDYPALNLAQSALLLMYELRNAEIRDSEIRDFEIGEPQRHAQSPIAHRQSLPQATAGELEQLFTATEAALHAVEFFKGRNPAVALRTLRQLAGRAGLNQREAALLSAIAREVAAFVGRKKD